MKKNQLPSIFLEIKKLNAPVLRDVVWMLSSYDLIGVADLAYYRVAGERCIGLTYTSNENSNAVIPGLKRFCDLANLDIAVLPYPWHNAYTIVFIKATNNWRASILSKITKYDILGNGGEEIADIDL